MTVMPCGAGLTVPRNRRRVMITYADVEKLLATRSEDPPVLSLYLEVPLDLPALRGLPVRAGELVNSAAGGPCGPGGPHAERALTEARQAVRRILEDSARDWLGHCVAIFICGPAGLAEAIPLPAGLGEQAVFGPRPHVRPLLVALQRQPAYRVVVVNRRHAWLFAVAGDRIDTVAQPAAAGVRSPRYGGWYGLESHRVNERIAELTHHHFHDIAGILAQAIRPGQERLVVGGHADTIPQFLATLPPDLRDRFAGSFVADTSTMTPARARALASPIIRNWVEKSGQQLVTRIRQEPPGGRAATGLAACIIAVRQHAVDILAMPGQGLVPGFACRRCGAVGATAVGCAHAGSAAFAVPDLIEEIAVSTLHDGGQVQAVPDPPGGIAAYLRFPLSRRDRT
jgi:Bacterial archaeo-eukaryotic release factor family 10